MPPTDPNLEERVAELERLLSRGNLPFESIPMPRLQDSLEQNWLPDGDVLIRDKSITAQQIGVLPAARRHTSTSYAIGAGAPQVMTMSVIDYDTVNMAPGGNQATFTIKHAGKYVLIANARIECGVTVPAYHNIDVYHQPVKTGVGRIVAECLKYIQVGTEQFSATTATVRHCSVGDKVWVTSSSGVTYTVYGTDGHGGTTVGDDFTNFSVQWVGS